MGLLSGITKESIEEFKSREDNSGKISFVRDKENNKQVGAIYFGNQQYGIADFQTSDNNLLVNYTDKGGLDINFNLGYDYEFMASDDTNGLWERILTLPTGTYTLFVEKTSNGRSVNGYVGISVDESGLYHTEYAVNSEILYYIVEGEYEYNLVIPCKDARAPWVRYRIKLIGSSVSTKSDIKDIHGSYFNTPEPTVIPCVTNNSSIIVINTADTKTTYCSTATPESVSEAVVGRTFIMENNYLSNYIINTDDVDDTDLISAVVISNSADTSTIANLPVGVYRFKFTDAVNGGFTVSCKDTYYTYTGKVVENAMLTLTVSDSYSDWTINNPSIYSSDKTIKVSADTGGGYDITVPAVEIGNKNIAIISGKVDSISGTYLSGVTINGSSENVTITDNVADLTIIKSIAGSYQNALVCEYNGLHGTVGYTKLFTAKVDDNSGEKFSIAFRILSNDSPNRVWEGEYVFDAHGVNNNLKTFYCIDFGATVYDSSVLNKMDDIFYVVTPRSGAGAYDYDVTFYKYQHGDYDMFNLLVDWVYGGNIQVEFYSHGYNSASEAIVGDIFGIKKNASYSATFGTLYQYTHSVAPLLTSVSGTHNYASDWREGNATYELLETTDKNLIGAVNEVAGKANNAVSGITINGSSEGVSEAGNVVNLTIKDYQDQIDYLSGVIDTLISSLNSLQK